MVTDVAIARWIAVSFSVAAAMLLGARVADAHPLHTTLTELHVDAGRHTVRAVVRSFADDLSAGLARSGAKSKSSADLERLGLAYVMRSFIVVDRGGRTLELRDCGIKRTAELVWFCVEGTVAGEVNELSLRNTVLFDAFPDQVNIVQVGEGSATHSVLFTRGDGLKRIR